MDKTRQPANQTVPHWSRSVDRPDRDTYQFPARVERQFALTAYDHEAGTLRIGDDLDVTIRGVYGAAHVGRWISRTLDSLAQLRRAGVRGSATVTVNWDDELAWQLEFRTPSGVKVRVDCHPASGFRYEQHVVRPHGFAHRTPTTPDGHDTHIALNADMVAEVRRELLAREVGYRLAELSATPTLLGARTVSAGYSQPGDGGIVLSVCPPGVRARQFAVTVTATGDVRVEDRTLPDQDQDAVWLAVARTVGVRGGKRSRAGERVADVFKDAAHTIAEHPDVAWLRDGSAPVGGCLGCVS